MLLPDQLEGQKEKYSLCQEKKERVITNIYRVTIKRRKALPEYSAHVSLFNPPNKPMK